MSDRGRATTTRHAARTTAPDRVIERYRSLFGADHGVVPSAVADVFTPDARVESAALGEPSIGHAAIVERVHLIRTALEGASARAVTEVEWVHRTARWCWTWHGPSGSHRGMDVARLAARDDRIELLVVFTGLLPPPA
ncbi:MAG: hypothetical protein S0880_27660 [Actinomycetota bacterium]|nr:hypothetical protein [Actinomycetota bacterium]